MAKFESKFTGTGVALVTPFLENGKIDEQGLRNLVDYVIAQGVDFLVALGTTGETPTLSSDEKHQVLDIIIEQNNKRLPIVVGAGGNNTAAVIDNIEKLNALDIDAILSVAPYYSKPNQEGLYQHFKAISKATRLPIILYNVPGRTASNILPATVVKLAENCENIVGIKEASGNIAQAMELIRLKPKNFVVLSGDDNLIIAQIACGMDGIISVVANAYGKPFNLLVNASIVNHYKDARKTLYAMLPLIDMLFEEGNPTGIKYVLSKMNIIQNHLRLPLVPASKNLAKRIDAFMAEFNY